MEKLYRKISVTNEKPLDKTPLFLVEITGAKNQNFPEDDNDWQFYLEEIPDPTAQLEADKAEMLEALEQADSIIKNRISGADTLEEAKYILDLRTKIESIIQKMK